MNDPLATYLHDHLAGANLAIELLRAMRTKHQDEPIGSFLDSLLAEIVEDRDTLKELAKETGNGQSTLKELGAWLSEKASRFKLGDGANGPFEVFEALEFLSLGILGKLSLWSALHVAARSDTRLEGVDFTRLIGRAESQYAAVEKRRISCAETALRRVKTATQT
jgi:hypothetical protein